MNLENKNVKLAVSYIISLVGLVFLYTEKEADEKTKAHYKQAATIFLFHVANTFVFKMLLSGAIPLFGKLSTLIFLSLLGLSIFAGVKAYNEQFFEIPVIFNLSKKIFK